MEGKNSPKLYKERKRGPVTEGKLSKKEENLQPETKARGGTERGRGRGPKTLR